MANESVPDDVTILAREILGYLNFLSGQRNTNFFRALSHLYTALARHDHQHLWQQTHQLLQQELTHLKGESETFKQADQATFALSFVFEKLLPAYREFHHDLLFHQSDDFLFSPFFLGRAFEAVLQQEQSWADRDEQLIIKTAIRSLNDFIGYRPVPVLEGREKNEPNPHEWVAPIPLYIEGAGVAYGKYQAVIEKGLEILRDTDPVILRDACLDPANIRELVLDPRAYDFDHPVNRRPNYHFGMWDSHTIDNNGYFRRFVLHQVTLDGILQRLESAYTGESDVSNIPYDQLLHEAGAILAGTMLMGAGISGDHTHTYDSNTSLIKLMPHIAAYRDRFYEYLMTRVPEPMRPRMEQEMKRLHQPFGGARQSLNKQLAKKRADQLQRFHLSRTLARMGYFEPARHQAEIIDVVSARTLCTIDCLITEGHLLADRKQLKKASEVLPKIEDMLHRGIACGAIADPWTIIGFGAQFSLFPAVDNTVHDHRIDDLINLLNDIFDLYSRLQKEAAAAGLSDLQANVSDKMSDLAGWWDQYGSMEVSGIEGFSGQAVWASANMVANALAAWNQAGTAAGDIQFWSKHVQRFESPKAYVMLGEALLEQRDLVATMALMMHWLSQSETIPLTEGDFSFHSLVLRWIEIVWKKNAPAKPNEDGSVKPIAILEPEKQWELTKKLFDYLEANADHYWNTPKFELESESTLENNRKTDDRHQSIDDTYSAAYENVTYRDTAQDGVDDDTAEGKDYSQPSKFQDDDDFELLKETDRISERLAFLLSLSKLWRYSATKSPLISGILDDQKDDAREKLIEWLHQAVRVEKDLVTLLNAIYSYEIPAPKGTQDSLMEYDRHRGTKEILIDRVVWTLVEVFDAIYTMFAILGKDAPDDLWQQLAPWQEKMLPVFTAAYRADAGKVKKHWRGMIASLLDQTLLYVPTSRGGNPNDIVKVRFLQQMIIRLFEYCPRLGLIIETVELLNTVEQMEQLHPLRHGAITEYDRLFEKATRAIAKCIAESSKKWRIRSNDPQFQSANEALVEYIERIIEVLLSGWLSHSRQIRISPVESIADKRIWEGMKGFIQKYGHDIFTQSFMGFGNLRAVLHQGTKNYLEALIKIYNEDGELETAQLLVEDLISGTITMDEAVYNLEVIFESIAENYSEYIDYNSTTIHSDRGERLYMLLDMLRVLTGYERISWNLKPVYWVHDEMIRSQCHEAAELWERAVAKRSIQAAEDHIKHYIRLSEKYGMWLPSVHERLQEQFIRPLQIDRMCGMVPAAVREARGDTPSYKAFTQLEEQIELFAKEPMGVGYEVPEWLTALQDEVLATRFDENDNSKPEDVYNLPPIIEQKRLSRTELDRQINSCSPQDS